MGYVAQLDPADASGPAVVDGYVGPGDVIEGDLIFTSRPGLLQDLCNRAGEPWRHVGVAAIHEGVMSITEVSRASFDIRPLDRVMAVNDEVAIARVTAAGREPAARAARWCQEHGRASQIYAWHDVMLAGLIATARHYTVQAEREALHRAIEAAAGVVGTRRPRSGATSYTCAAFIAEAFAFAGHPLQVDLRIPRAADDRPPLTELIRGRTRPQLRAGRPTTREYGIVLYALLAGLLAARGGPPPTASAAFDDLTDTPSHDPPYADEADEADAGLDQFRWAMPGDLWRSPTVTERFIILSDAVR